MGEDGFSEAAHKAVRPVVGEPGRTSLPDLEDLAATVGREHGGCPYYFSHLAAVDADLVVCPYNYILDPKAGKGARVDLRDRIIVLDEAHNIEQVCRDAGTVELSSLHINEFSSESSVHCWKHKLPAAVPACMRFPAACRFGPDEIPTCYAVDAVTNFFRVISGKLVTWSERFGRRRTLGGVGTAGDGLELLRTERGEQHYATTHRWEVESWAPYKGKHPKFFLEEIDMGIPGVAAGKAPANAQTKKTRKQTFELDPKRCLTIIRELTKHLVRSRTEDASSIASHCRILEDVAEGFVRLARHPEQFAVSVGLQVSGTHRDEGNWPVFITLYLLSPAVMFERLAADAHSIVLASGTLSPVESFFTELGDTFAERQVSGKYMAQPLSPLEAAHVIDASQLLVQKISHTVNRRVFSTEFKTLRPGGLGWNEELLIDLGWSIVHLTKKIPGGVLVFLPSYGMLKKVSDLWRSLGSRVYAVGPTVYEALVAAKHYVLEENAKTDIDELKRTYTDQVDTHGRCLLLGVMRAKCSEGISFNDNYARGVIVVGIAFPNSQAAEVKHKREFNTDLRQRALRKKREIENDLRRARLQDAHVARDADARGGNRGSGASRRLAGIGRGSLDDDRDPGAEQVTELNRDAAANDPDIGARAEPAADVTLGVREVAVASAVGRDELQKPEDVRLPLDGGEWYSQQAFRAINQALGRCVRHRNDFGAMFLFDVRWETDAARYESKLSRWLRDIGVEPPRPWPDMEAAVEAHFARNEAKRARRD